MRIVVAGSSGFLGTGLVARLAADGHDVTRLVRRPPRRPDESRWDPYAGALDRSVVDAADVVVNLAGTPTVGNPHSSRWARRLRDSRVETTRLLAETIAGSDAPPAFLAQNGISVYGDHGDEVVTEESDSRGDALLTRVTREWEAATAPARDAGARVCVLRTAPIMDGHSPPLKQLRLAFRAGLGARLGDGSQHDPMISLRDWVAAAIHLTEHPTASGPFNLCCPATPTNTQFTEALARAVGRRAFLAAPAPVLKVAAGAMGPELLGSINARPAAIEATGYQFRDPDVAAVLAAGLS